MDDREKFLSRWSRRKRQARLGDAEDEGAGPDPAGAIAGERAELAGGGADERARPAAGDEDAETLIGRLPDIDALTDKSDFRPFMDPRIPDALRNRALRKLWRTNPVFANLDGLNDYDGDYTDAAMVVPGLKTAYQVGRGILRQALDGPPEPEAAETEAAQATPAADREPDPVEADTEKSAEPDREGGPDQPPERNKIT